MKYYQGTIGSGGSDWYGASPISPDDSRVDLEWSPVRSRYRADNQAAMRQQVIINRGIAIRNAVANMANELARLEAVQLMVDGVVTKHDYMMETSIPEYLR